MKKLFEIRDRRPIIARAVSDVLYFAALLLSDLALRYIHVECKTSPFGRDVPLLYTLCWCAVFTALAMLLPKIVRRIYVIFTESVFALIALIHAFFYSFFGSYMSFSSVTFAETGADFFDWSYFSIPKKLLLALAAAVLLSVAAALLTPKKVNLKILPIILSVILIAAGVVGINCLSEKNFSDAGGITWNSTQTPAEVYETFTDQFTCMHMVGLYQYSFRDFMVSTGLDDVWLKFNNSSAVKELDAYYASKETDPDNEMTGIFKGKNLILIQLEAIDTWMLNGDVMPNLNRLRSEGINFSNYYAPKYLWGATFNSENVANTGLISPTNSSKVSYFNKTAYPYSMANVFKAAGYDTNSFHRSNGNVYNRGTIHINWGYNTYNSAPSLGISEIDLDSKFIEAYDKMVSEDKFMSFYITYSGHGPYNSETKEAQLYTTKSRLSFPRTRRKNTSALSVTPVKPIILSGN